MLLTSRLNLSSEDVSANLNVSIRYGFTSSPKPPENVIKNESTLSLCIVTELNIMILTVTKLNIAILTVVANLRTGLDHWTNLMDQIIDNSLLCSYVSLASRTGTHTLTDRHAHPLLV